MSSVSLARGSALEPSEGRVLIVNADDFGWSLGITRGIFEAHERGIVTSASLMVLRPAARDAVECAREHPSLAVGLHVELGEAEAAEDLTHQLGAFRALTGRDPTHLDSHHHVHRDEPARSALVTLGRELSVPVRHFTPSITFCGDFYGRNGVTVGALVALLESLSGGATELMCHPAAEVDFESSYGEERLRELETLCDPRVREAVRREGIALVSFAQLPQ